MTLTADQIASAVPLLAEGVERLEVEGQVLLRGRELRRGALARLWAWCLRLPARVTVELDEIGAFVVARMDGRNMADLSSAVADHCRLTRREARVALTEFVRLLLQRKLVRLDGLLETRA